MGMCSNIFRQIRRFDLRLYMYAFMTHCDVCLRVGEPLGGAVVTGGDPMGPVVTGAVARSQTSDSETAGDDHGVRGGPNTAAGAGAFVQAGKDFMFDPVIFVLYCIFIIYTYTLSVPFFISLALYHYIDMELYSRNVM